MVSYRYLGYGTTDSQGFAILDHDANGNAITDSYTGTGAGKIDIVASLDSTITDDSIISEVMSIIDAQFYDEAIYGSTGWNNVAGVTVGTSTSGGTPLSNPSGTKQRWAKNYAQFSDSFAVELDLTGYSGSVGVIFAGSTSHYIYFSAMNCPQNCHVKLIYDGHDLKYQVNEGAITTFVNGTSSPFYVGLRFAGESSMTYKNFVVYTI